LKSGVVFISTRSFVVTRSQSREAGAGGAEGAPRLPAYTEPKSVTWRASDGGRITDRLRSAFKDLFGRRG